MCKKQAWENFAPCYNEEKGRSFAKGEGTFQMKELKKRYRIKSLGADGKWQSTYAADLETAAEYARKVHGTVYAVYSKRRSNVYMDEDEYIVEVKV